MSNWYDKEGKLLIGDDIEVGSPEWVKGMQKVEELLSNREYKIIKQECTPGKEYWVSTVWLGLDHSFTGGKPLIFETMVFDGERHNNRGSDYAQKRYSTEEEALRGHAKLLDKFTKKENK